MKLCLPHFIYYFIEHGLAKLFENALVTHLLIRRHAVKLRVFVKNFRHLQNRFRLLLQVRVNNRHVLAAGFFKSCKHCGLLAEIA